MLSPAGESQDRLGARRRDTLAKKAARPTSIIVRAPLPAALFDAAPKKLRAAIRHGAGLDMIPIEAATKAGVLVANVPGVNARSVAEHVFFVTMALLRRFRMMDRDLRQKGWLAGRDHADKTHELHGRTLGVVGAGNVGKAVMATARAGFGLDVIANSRNPKSLPDDVRFVSVDELVAESDIVVLCCPLTPETAGLLSRERIARMRPGAILVNVSRGAVVDDTGLIAALSEGRIGGAALDVFVDAAAAARSPLFRVRQRDRHAAYGRHHRREHDAHGRRRRRGGDPRARQPPAGQSAQPEVLEDYRKRFPARWPR